MIESKINLKLHYEIEIDDYNLILVKYVKDKRTVIGYYSPQMPRTLLKALLYNNVCSENSKVYKSLEDYITTFNKSVEKVRSKIGLEALVEEIERLRIINKELLVEKKALKGALTRTKNKCKLLSV